ncbi:unnamed protein product [Closterium sp. NIES-54]
MPVLSPSAYRARLSRALAPAAPAVASPLLSRPVQPPLLSHRVAPCCPVASRLSLLSRRVAPVPAVPSRRAVPPRRAVRPVLGLPPSPGPPLLSPPPVQSQLQLQPTSPLPGPSLYSRPTRGLMERREPESRPVSPESRSESPLRTVRAGRRVSRPRPPPVPGTHSMTLRPSTAPQRVPLPSPPASSLPDGPDPESDSLRAARPTVTRFLATVATDPLFQSTAASALIAELVDFAAACHLDFATSLVAESASTSVCPPSVRDLDAPDIPTPRSYVEVIEGPYSSQWQAAMDAEMASWKSAGTYVNEVPPPGANIISGMWIFRVKRPPGSPLVFKARYVTRGFSQRQGVDFFHTFSPTPKMTTRRVLLHVAAQRDYELHSLDFSTAFLQGSLHEEIWLRRPPGFTGSFPAGTQWSLRWLVYGLRQAPREWHDTVRTTLAALGFAPSTADPSLFLRTDATLPPFYVLVYVDDLVFATADTEALAHVKHTCTDLGELTSYLGLRITRDRAQRTITLTQSHMVQQVLQRFGFTYSSPQSTPLPTGHSLSAPPLDEPVEPSGPYLELVGCLMYLMTCTRPELAYPLSLLARYVAPGRHRKVHWDAPKRVLRYLCSTLGMGLVLGGRARVVLTGHVDASWVEVSVSKEEISGVTDDGGEPEVEQQQQQQQEQGAPQGAGRTADRPRRDVRPPNRLTYASRGKPKVVRAGSVAEQCDEDEIAHCYWAAVPEPKTLAEALSGPDAEKWKQSVKEEYDSLLENETWELCELPPGKKAISSKLIFRHKYGPDGALTRYKSRLVAKGFQQTKGKDFN